MKTRIGIMGYGNLGRGVEAAIHQNEDLELVAVRFSGFLLKHLVPVDEPPVGRVSVLEIPVQEDQDVDALVIIDIVTPLELVVDEGGSVVEEPVLEVVLCAVLHLDDDLPSAFEDAGHVHDDMPVLDVDSFSAEKAVTDRWLSDAQADPILRFGLQQGGLPMDPHSQTEDLGDDSMKASEYGIKNLKYILSHLNEWVKDDADFEYRKDIYTGIVYQYYNYLLHVYANIGGVYLWQKCDGDPVERAHQVVPPETQKRALQFLMDQVSDMDWLDNAALLADIPTVGQPSKVLKAFLAQAIVSAPAKVARTIAVAEKDDPVYSVKECLKDVNDFVWKPTGTLNDVQMMLQREFLSLTFAASGYSYAGNGAVPSRSTTGLMSPWDTALRP